MSPPTPAEAALYPTRPHRPQIAAECL